METIGYAMVTWGRAGEAKLLALVLDARRCRGQRHWQPQWRTPAVKRRYQVVVVGAGGHGLATAYYLAKNHGITDVAVLEKGWLGGGNTGRNTTVVRSNYLFPESAAIYDLALRLYEGLSRDLNYNIMLSQRGIVTLAHSRAELDGMARWVTAMQVNGIDSEILDRAGVQRLVPTLKVGDDARYPVVGGFLQRRGGIARHGRGRLGLRARRRRLRRRHHPELRGPGPDVSRRTRRWRRDDARPDRGGAGGPHCGGAQLRAGRESRISSSDHELRAAGVRQRARQAHPEHRRAVAGHRFLCEPVRQGRARHGRRTGPVQLVCAAR